MTKVERLFEDFQYQAQSWDKPRRVIAKIEWHPGELFPKIGFIVTNLPMEPDEVTRFYNRRGTAEQHIKEGKYAFHWTRLSCKRLRDNEVRLQLHALAYNLATADQPPAQADQDRGPRGASCPFHHLPAGRGRGHRPDGASDSCRHTPTASAAVMRVTAIQAQTERKRQNRSVRRAENAPKGQA